MRTSASATSYNKIQPNLNWNIYIDFKQPSQLKKSIRNWTTSFWCQWYSTIYDYTDLERSDSQGTIVDYSYKTQTLWFSCRLNLPELEREKNHITIKRTNFIRMGCLCIGSEDHLPTSVFAVLMTTIVMSFLHILIGCVSVCIGVISSVQAEVWLAHRVSPIWSGGFVSKLSFFLNKTFQKLSR